MERFKDETELTHIQMVQRVVDMFESRPGFQQIVRLGLLANMNYSDELDVTDEDDYEYDHWGHGHNNSRGYPRLSDSRDRGFSGNHARPSSSVYHSLHYPTASHDLPHPSSVRDDEKEGGLVEGTKKGKGKAEKKRLKKKKQKQRKQLEQLEKEKQNPEKNEEESGSQQCKGEGSETVDDKSNSGVQKLASAKDTDSSDSKDESSNEDSDTKNDSDDFEELDMTSTFVSKAALIAMRKLDHRPRPERKEKKKIPIKEETKTVPDKPNEDPQVKTKGCDAPSNPTLEDNVKISTDLANIGNKFASAGDFNTAVKYFTDAIKYNPTEFKLFGNRSFCFEKMQEYLKALTDAELSLSICPGWVKGLFRKGRALAGLKRYEEAAEAFREVLKLDSSYAEAAQELMRVQITQLMAYGFTREQSYNALIIHGTVKKATEVLSNLNHLPGASQNGTAPLAQVANASGVSPVLSASTHHAPPQSKNAQKTPLKNKPVGSVQNMSNDRSQPTFIPKQAIKPTNEVNHQPQELFPVWVGNLFNSVSEAMLTNLFNKAGVVYSVKLLSFKRCAFINYTKQEHCDEAIRRFHGFEMNGIKIVVRYPDRFPQGMGISKSAHKAHDLRDESIGQNDYVDGRYAVGNRRPVRPYRPENRGNNKH